MQRNNSSKKRLLLMCSFINKCLCSQVMANLIDFEDPERLRVYESLSDFHKLKNSLMFRLYQEHVSNINIPHSYNGEQLCSQNELNEEFLKWLNTVPRWNICFKL